MANFSKTFVFELNYLNLKNNFKKRKRGRKLRIGGKMIVTDKQKEISPFCFFC